MSIIDIAGVGKVDFPDSMSDADILNAIQTKILPQSTAHIKAPPEQLPVDWREGTLGQQFKHGFGRAMTGLGSTVTDLIPALAGSALGFKDYAAEQLAEHKAKMEASEAQNPTAFKSFRDVRGVGDAVGFAAETFGELIPDIVALMTGAGAASVVGKRVALRGVQELAVKEAAKRGLTGEAAETLVQGAMQEAGKIGSTAGLKYGLPASSYALNAPDTFQSIYEKTEEQSPGIAALMGVPIAMLDTFLPGQILRKLGMAGKAKLGMAIINDSKVLPGSFKTAALKELGTVVAAEGLTESAQEALTVAAEMMAGAKGEFFSQENIDRYINAGLKGAIGGGAFGTPGAIRSGLQAKGERDRLAGEAAARTEEEAQRPAFELTSPTPPVEPRPDFELTPSAPPEASVDTGQTSFDFGEPASAPTGQMELNLGTPPTFKPSEERTEDARKQAQDTKQFDPTAVAPFDAATAERTQRFDPKTSAIATAQPDLFGLVYPPVAEEPTAEPIGITKKLLTSIGIPKNAPVVKRLDGLDLADSENISTAITQLAQFAANPMVPLAVKSSVTQFISQLRSAVPETQGVLQFGAQPAPAGKKFGEPISPFAQKLQDAQKQRDMELTYQQTQEAAAKQKEIETAQLGNIAGAQRQLDIAQGEPSDGQGYNAVPGASQPSSDVSVQQLEAGRGAVQLEPDGLGSTAQPVGATTVGESAQPGALEQQAAADKAEIQRKINKVALNDQKAKIAAAKVVADKFAADKVAADKKAKAETDEAASDESAALRKEARAILLANGLDPQSTKEALEPFAEEITQEDIESIRKAYPPQRKKGTVYESQVDQLSTPDARVITPSELAAEPDTIRKIDRLEAEHTAAQDEVTHLKTRMRNPAMAHRAAVAAVNSAVDSWVKLHSRFNYSPSIIKDTVQSMLKDPAAYTNQLRLSDTTLDAFYNRNPPTEESIAEAEATADLRQEELVNGVRELQREQDLADKLLQGEVHDVIHQQIKAGVIPKPFAPFYHAVARGDTKAALTYIAAKGANLIHRQVATFLLVNNVFPPIKFVNEQTEIPLSNGKVGYAAGTYSSAADNVYIDSGLYLQRAYPNTINEAIKTLLHELVHAGTVNAMSKAYEVYTRLLQSAAPLSAADAAYTKTGEYKSAVELFKLFDYLKKTYPKQFKKSIHYGATNPFEMVAEILTDKGLQEFLSNISLPQKEFPTPKPISAFALFVSKIKQLIASAVKAAGYSTVPNSALEHVINATIGTTRKRAGSGSVRSTEQEKTGHTQFHADYASANVSPSAIDARIVETGVAPPLLSQQTVKNVFESALRLTEKLPGMNPERVDQIHQLLKDSTSTAARAGLLAVLPLNILGEVAKKALGVHGEKVNTLVNERAGVIHKRNKEIEALVNRANNWAKGAGKPTVKLFNDVVYDSTTLEVDPTKNESDYAAQTGTAEALSNAAKKQAEYRKVKAMYNSLPPEGQKLYVEMRDAYREMYKNLLKSLRQRVNASLEDREGSAAIADGIFRKLVERAHIDPYFPLTRTGAYWLSYDTVENGQSDYVVKSFETERGRERFIRDEKAANKKASNFVSYSNLKNFNYKKVPSTSFINDVVKVLETGVIDPATKTRVHVPAANIEAIVQLFLDTLPETAFAQSFQRREQVMGYERDAIGAMRQRLFNTSRQLANMEYAPKLNNAVDNMKQLSKLARNAGDDNSVINAYVNEYEKRIAFINNPTISKLSQFATGIGFNMLLGLNPASALVNGAQVPMVTLPYLGGEYGYAKASAAVMNAYKIFAGSGRSKTVDVFGTLGTTYTRSAMYSLDNYSAKDPAFARYKTLMGVLETQGQMSSSQVYDTLEASDGTTLGSRVNAFTGWMFHQADRVNRQVTAIAAYDLELDRLKKAGAKTSDGIVASTLSKEERETAAANHAVYVTEMTQGGTSAASAPRIAQGAVGRVLFMFKRYGVSMMYLQLRILRDALRSEDKAVRKAAMAQFAGMSGMAALAAGVQGLPMFGALSVLYGMFKDDDEDDLEMVTRKYMGTMLTNGPLSYVTNLDFSGRVSMSDLLFREMRTGDKPSVVASILEQLGGPVYGVASKVERGFKLMQDGNILRGIEQVMPSGIGNIFKAARFATEGANTLRGDPITGDVSIFNVSAQALGFSPSDYQRQNELNNRLKGIDKYVSEKETKLFRKYYTAGRMGDREAQTEIKDELRELFRKHPGLGSLEEALGRSMKAHEKTTSRMRSGIVVNEKLRAELERYARDAGE